MKFMKYFYVVLFSYLACSCSSGCTADTWGEQTLESIPGKTKLQKTVYIDGITIRDFNFINNKKTITCHPNEEVKFSLVYDIDTEKLPAFHMHRLVIGLDPLHNTQAKEADKNVGPQQIVLTNLGFFDEQGKKESTLKSPLEKGTYFVRFAHGKGITFHQAQESWLKEGPEPKSVMGILIVK